MTFGKQKPMRLQLPLVKLVKKFSFTFSFSRVDTKSQFSAKRIYECHNDISEKYLLHRSLELESSLGKSEVH